MPFAATLSTVSVNEKAKRNKLRRRRRPSPPRTMALVAGDVEHVSPDESVVGSDTPTLLDSDKEKHEQNGSVTQSPKSRDLILDEAQAQVISSLRSQIQDLISQVTQLNGKLVKSYDRVSDLEDELHVASSNLRQNSIKISQLELDRTQHLAALNTGLLVEKAHVTSELTRLMERATDEAARRGQAENARANIEKELDDLSANLFDQANRMVAEARYAKAMSERKVVDAEMALRSAEEAVGLMQGQMQALREDKNKSEEEMERMKALMGKGKFAEQSSLGLTAVSVKLLSCHTPYQEFLLFISHLRSVRPSATQPPHISTFLPLPFLARLATEDSDPTVRLDFAPSLNWLSRRSVLSAIYSGQLTIEPMHANVLLLESQSTFQSMIPGSHSGPSCALCGTLIFPKPEPSHAPPPTHPYSLSLPRPSAIGNSAAWSSSIFKNPLSNNASAAPSPPPTPPPQHTVHTSANSGPTATPTTVYVFRLAQTQTPSHPTQAQQKPTNYPICGSGWCLARLRTTCSLWAFVRAGVIDRVWEEEPRTPIRADFSHARSGSTATTLSDTTLASSTVSLSQIEKEKAPPLPPRRRSKMSSVGASVGSLWGMASGALRSQPQSPVRQPEKEKALEKDGSPSTTSTPKQLSVNIPPPLPRRSTDRAARASSDDKLPTAKTDESISDSVSDANKSETSEKTYVRSNGGTPPPEGAGAPLSQSTSESSSAPGAASDEFTTPVEELNALPLLDVRATMTSPPAGPPRAPRSPIRASASPPPVPPLSPRAVPLPESRPGSPFAANFSRSRPTSTTVAPLHVQTLQSQLEDGKPPSRAASPVPSGAAPPPVPRRAAARRTAPVPPGAPGIQASISAASLASERTSPDDEEKELPESDAVTAESKTEAPEMPPRTSEDAPRPVPPPPPPRRVDHLTRPTVAKANNIVPDTVSVSDYGDNDDKTVEVAKEDEKDETDGIMHGSYVGESSWEDRTWKEIVRLREDMFWARVGGIRS